MILVSACLAGCSCRYDGRSSPSPELLDFLAGREWIAVCPEQLGGLPTPRPAARIQGGNGTDVIEGRARVVDARGTDVTESFMAGARVVLDLARRLKIETCYLKDRSPSCAAGEFRNREGRLEGPGVCAALLMRNGFKVVEVAARGADGTMPGGSTPKPRTNPGFQGQVA
ncbi:MAG: DUF523 domain-containing protein [Thermodesulfobacteriota bacterium]